MTLLAALALALAGAAMGFINNLAGAGGLIGLAALEYFAGQATADQNASLRPAAVAISTCGVLGFLSTGQRIPASSWWYGLASVPGAVAGTLMAIELPEWVYRAALVVVVTAVIVQQSLPAAQRGSETHPRRVGPLATIALFTAVGVHMGFLQVAAGLLTMFALSFVMSGDLVAINKTKMALLMLTSTTSVACFAQARAIQWTPALLLAAGAAAGSFVAGRWSVRKGHSAVRAAVLAVCAFLLVRLAVQLVTE